MEGNLPTGRMMQGASFGMLDLQNPIHMHHPSFLHHQKPNSLQRQGSMVHQQILDTFPQSGNHAQEPPMTRTSCSDEDEPSFTNEDGVDNGVKTGWQRMKWTDQMVRLLITAVSYLGEDAASDYCHNGGRRKHAILQRKGKWRSISRVLAERACYVSPQQCEDKFNDLNKRYKRLTDILGRGTSCKIVENPALLDVMDNLSVRAKEEARKILSSKHLFYEEMCSYHNGNRVNLPADPALQRSLQLALRSRDDAEDDVDSDDVDDDAEEHGGPYFPKRSKKGTVDMNQALGADYMKSRKVQLEEQSLHIRAEMLVLKKQRLKWLRFNKKKDGELERMRMENKRMKVENEQLELELKRKELELNRS